MATGTEYNGWKNRQTWNVWLWIANTESLYTTAVEFMNGKKYGLPELIPDRKPYGGKHPYFDFIKRCGLIGRTPDNIAWLSTRLDYVALNEAMRELVQQQ